MFFIIYYLINDEITYIPLYIPFPFDEFIGSDETGRTVKTLLSDVSTIF